LKEIKFQQGDTVTGQQVIAIIEEGAVAAAAPAVKAEPAPQVAATPAPAAAPTPADTLPPGARFTAITQNINPAEVQGTGRRGSVTKEDLLNYATGK